MLKLKTCPIRCRYHLLLNYLILYSIKKLWCLVSLYKVDYFFDFDLFIIIKQLITFYHIFYQRSSNPQFLCTIIFRSGDSLNILSQIRFTAFDVREKVSQTAVPLGFAEIALGVIQVIIIVFLHCLYLLYLFYC